MKLKMLFGKFHELLYKKERPCREKTTFHLIIEGLYAPQL